MIGNQANAYTTSAQREERDQRGTYKTTALWFFRGLLLIPFVLMVPEVVSRFLGRPGVVANISASVADVFGTSTFLMFITMLAVTPVYTITVWRWHLGVAALPIAAGCLTSASVLLNRALAPTSLPLLSVVGGGRQHCLVGCGARVN